MTARPSLPPSGPGLAGARRLVVKIGSALIADGTTGRVRILWLASVAADIAALRANRAEVIVVSSGAIALARRTLGFRGRIRLEEQQAAAAVGQIRLAQAWSEALSAHGLVAAQLLLTLGDTEDRRRYLNARATLATLLAAGAIPVINENDSVATSEIRFGDNDRLAARVAAMVSADRLVLLSDIDGLYTADPRKDFSGRHIPIVERITPAIEAMGGDAGSLGARGGMRTKLEAAKIATRAGVAMAVARGTGLHPLRALAEGGRASWFLAEPEGAQARKRWIAGALAPLGQIAVDAGAAAALRAGRSLLPAGVVAVAGDFARGDPVLVRSADGTDIAKGLSAYASDDARRIAGHRSSEIAALLGWRGRDELVHRDDLVLLDAAEDPVADAVALGEKVRMNAEDGGATAQLRAMAERAREAAQVLAGASRGQRDAALAAAARELRTREGEILAANERDLAQAAESTAAFRDRLMLDPARIAAIAGGFEEVASLPDPLARPLGEWTRPNGLRIRRIPQPIGVIAMIYESRPNVGADAAALCLKSGNAVILRGGSESFASAAAIHEAVAAGLSAAGLPVAAVQTAPSPDRAFVAAMLAAAGQIDLMVPRGGKGLVERVAREARMPVLAHAEGLCHTYVHERADAAMARRVVANAKMRRTGVCGATETLLIDAAVARKLLPAIIGDLAALGCRFRADARARAVMPELPEAEAGDFDTEWLDAVLSVAVVDGVEGALAHIARHASSHTDAIVTEDKAAAESFLAGVSSAVALWNASTQFCDGGEFGFGAEIGIATGRVHARGPVGLEQLTTYRYLVIGTGQVRP